MTHSPKAMQHLKLWIQKQLGNMEVWILRHLKMSFRPFGRWWRCWRGPPNRRCRYVRHVWCIAAHSTFYLPCLLCACTIGESALFHVYQCRNVVSTWDSAVLNRCMNDTWRFGDRLCLVCKYVCIFIVKQSMPSNAQSGDPNIDVVNVGLFDLCHLV